MERTGAKISYLDGIRGLAAFLVFFHHFCLVFYTSFYNWNPVSSHLNGLEIKYGQSVFSFLTNGNFCVCIFFVLSGFVLSRKYYQNNNIDTVVSGAQRRFIRLYIPIAFTLILSYVILKAGLYYNVQVSQLTHAEWWFSYKWFVPHPEKQLAQCLAYKTLFEGDSTFDTCLWSMSSEFYGSMMVYVLLALTHNTKVKVPVLLLILAVCLIKSKVYPAAFVLGILLNYVERTKEQFNYVLTSAIAVVLLIVGLGLGSYPSSNIVAGTVFEHLPVAFQSDETWYHVTGAFLVIIAFVISARLQRMISLRFFTFLGYISFSLYLLHPIIIGSFSSICFVHLYAQMSYNLAALLVLMLTIGITLLAAWLMTKYVDDPGVKFSKYFYTRFMAKEK